MFRNDLEAALARAAAAERELAELRRKDDAERARIETLEQELAAARAEAARLKKSEPKPVPPRRPEPAPAAKSGTPRSPAIKWVAASVLGVGAIVAIVLGKGACDRHRAMTGPGELYAAHVVTTRDGQPRLIVVSEAINMRHSESGGERWRGDVVDPRTGQRLLRKLWGDRAELLPAGPGRVWCDLDGSYVGKRNLIEQCDVETLAVVVSVKDLLARHPQLDKGFAYSPSIDLGSGALITTTQAGEVIRIGADLSLAPFRAGHDEVCMESMAGGGRVLRATLEASLGRELAYDEGGNCATLAGGSRYDSELSRTLRAVPRVRGLGQSQDGSTPSLGAAGGYRFETFDSGRREGLFLESGNHDQKMTRIGDASFIEPEALMRYGSDDAIVFPGGSIIVCHRDALDYNTAGLLISGFDLATGTTRWTITLPPGEVKLGAQFDELAVIGVRLFSDKRSVLLAVDWKTGQERWRSSL